MEVCRQLTNLVLVERVREPGRSSSCHFGSCSSAHFRKTRAPPRARQLHQKSYPQRNQSTACVGLPRPGSRNLHHLTDSRMPSSCSPRHHGGSRRLKNTKARQQIVRSGPCPGSCKHCHAVTDRRPWWFVTDEVVATAVSASAGTKTAASPARSIEAVCLANSVVSHGRHEISEAEKA